MEDKYLQTINIMTSCDGNLMRLIPVQLESIAANLSDKKINFYLFHDGKNNAQVKRLNKLNYDNINIKDIIVKNINIYDEIAKYGGGWCSAAYYSLCAHEYLPTDMDRIWYIDAGDLLVVGNVDEYYFADFENKSIIATSILFKVEDDKFSLFERKDMFNPNYLKGIARGLFNSGSYIINLEKMRKSHYSLKDYANLAKLIYESRGKLPQTFFGDQGFLSLVFVGDIKIFSYPQISDPWYMPYNFCMWYFDKMTHKVDYDVKVVHYAGCKFKPWYGRYSTFLKHFQNKKDLRDLNELKSGQAEYYQLWYEYAIKAELKMQN